MIDNADKTFLWVALILDLVETSVRVSRNALVKIMDTIPGSLIAMYEEILTQNSDAVNARKVLHIIVAATRPYSLKDINVALNIDEKVKSYDQSNLEPVKESAIQRLCGPLLKVLHSHVYMSHQTAKKFLIKRLDADVTEEGVWKHLLDARKLNCVLA